MSYFLHSHLYGLACAFIQVPIYLAYAPSFQVLICVHDERAGGELHGASELREPETQALHL